MENNKKKIWIFGSIAYAVFFILVMCLSNTEAMSAWFSSVLRILRPLIIGLVLAYLLNPFFRFFETKMLSKVKPIRLRRVIALILTYLLLFLIFTVLILLIVPQLVQSITDFIDDADAYLHNTISGINRFLASLNNRLAPGEAGPLPVLDLETIKQWLKDTIRELDLKEKLDQLLTLENIGLLLGAVKNVAFVVADIVFGFFSSLYLLNTKEKRYAQIMRYRHALLSDEANARLTRFCTVADRSFGGFLEGKIIDSTIIGFLVYVLLSFLDVPYAILIATIIGITDIVPIIGPFVGVIPTAVIVVLSDPGKLIPFLLCILLVQQIDGNIIAPKILGENTGVSSLCVIVAITTMGALWGLAGMVMGVPLFATALELGSEFIDKQLEKKGIAVQKKAEEPEKIGLLQRFKKKALRLQANVAEGGAGDLTRMERFQLDTYSLAIKYHLFSETSEEALNRFSTEKKALLSAVESVDADMIPPTTAQSDNGVSQEELETIGEPDKSYPPPPAKH